MKGVFGLVGNLVDITFWDGDEPTGGYYVPPAFVEPIIIAIHEGRIVLPSETTIVSCQGVRIER